MVNNGLSQIGSVQNPVGVTTASAGTAVAQVGATMQSVGKTGGLLQPLDNTLFGALAGPPAPMVGVVSSASIGLRGIVGAVHWLR